MTANSLVTEELLLYKFAQGTLDIMEQWLARLSCRPLLLKWADGYHNLLSLVNIDKLTYCLIILLINTQQLMWIKSYTRNQVDFPIVWWSQKLESRHQNKTRKAFWIVISGKWPVSSIHYILITYMPEVYNLTTSKENIQRAL